MGVKVSTTQFRCVAVADGWDMSLVTLSASDAKLLVTTIGKRVDKICGNCNRDSLLIRAEKLPVELPKIEWEKVEELSEIFPNETATVWVILYSPEGKIYYVANMNQEAFENSKRDKELWVYSKTNAKLQKKWATSGDTIEVIPETFEQGVDSDGNRILRVQVEPTTDSVCHEKDPNTWRGYPTCYFRHINDIIE